MQTYTLQEIRGYSSQMTEYLSSVQDFMNTVNLGNRTPDEWVILSLADWMNSQTPIMWVLVNGPTLEYPGPASAIAARVIQSSVELQIPMPTLAFFCRWPYDYDTDIIQGQKECLVDLVYNILRQLLEWLPGQFATTLDLSESRFSELGGSFGSLPKALDLLADVLTMAPPRLLIVIDGMDHLDSTHVEKEVNQFFSVLMDGVLLARSREMVFKLFFTTTNDFVSLTRIGLADDNWLRKLEITQECGNRQSTYYV